MRRTTQFAAGRRVIGLIAGWVIVVWSAAAAPAQSPRLACPCDRPSTVRPFSPWSAVIPPVLSPSVSTASVPLQTEVYLSDNANDDAALQLVVPERVLNRLFAEERRESGPVRDFVLGANVFGHQSTVIRPLFDCRPNRDHAEVYLVLQGMIYSDTVGVTPQSAVNTLGRHGVMAIKPVMFDGRQITTRRAATWVNIHNQYVAASTPLEGVPLLDAIARETVLSAAELRRPRSDAVAAARLGSQFGGEFNRRTDGELAQLNRTWRDDLQTKYGELWPDRVSLRTTESQLTLAAAWGRQIHVNSAFPAEFRSLTTSAVNKSQTFRHQVLASTSDASTLDDSVTLRIHESAINALLQRSSLAGKTYSATQLRDTFETMIAKLGGRIVMKGKTPTVALPGNTTLIRLADSDPVSVKFEDRQLLLRIRASVEVAGKTVLPQDDITMPVSWDGDQDPDHWLVQFGPLALANASEDISLGGIVATLVRAQLDANLPDIELPKSIERPATETPLKTLRLEKADLSSGWLTLSLGVEGPGIPGTDFSEPHTKSSAREDRSFQKPTFPATPAATVSRRWRDPRGRFD